jgi:hypothetical protein
LPVGVPRSASNRCAQKRYGVPSGTICDTALPTATPASAWLLTATRSAPVRRSTRSRLAVARCCWTSPATRAITSRNITLDAVAIIRASWTVPRTSSTTSVAGAISAARDMPAMRRPPAARAVVSQRMVSRRIDGCSADMPRAV